MVYFINLFLADISGYTNLSEKLSAKGPRGAEEVSICLNNYWENLVRITTKSGGDVFKYVGDAVVIVVLYLLYL